jgi:hypothetical protein
MTVTKTLSLWKGVLREKPSIVILVKKFPAFYANRNFMIMFTQKPAAGSSPKRESSPLFPIPLLYDSF